MGYGDPRHAPSGTHVLVGDRPATLVGRVSVDMLAIDLGAHSAARVGESVLRWGEGLPVELITRHADTIAYELLCRITGASTSSSGVPARRTARPRRRRSFPLIARLAERRGRSCWRAAGPAGGSAPHGRPAAE